MRQNATIINAVIARSPTRVHLSPCCTSFPQTAVHRVHRPCSCSSASSTFAMQEIVPRSTSLWAPVVRRTPKDVSIHIDQYRAGPGTDRYGWIHLSPCCTSFPQTAVHRVHRPCSCSSASSTFAMQEIVPRSTSLWAPVVRRTPKDVSIHIDQYRAGPGTDRHTLRRALVTSCTGDEGRNVIKYAVAGRIYRVPRG